MSDNINEILETKSDSNQQISEGGYFSFQKMISGTLIKIMYAIGLIAITIGGVGVIIDGFNQRRGGELIVLGGLALVIFGNLIWRIICEGLIIIFSIHETTVSILNELKRR